MAKSTVDAQCRTPVPQQARDRLGMVHAKRLAWPGGADSSRA
jgi:hypothetical protein